MSSDFHSDRTISEEYLGYPENLLHGRSLDDLVRKVDYLAMIVLELMPPKRQMDTVEYLRRPSARDEGEDSKRQRVCDGGA